MRLAPPQRRGTATRLIVVAGITLVLGLALLGAHIKQAPPVHAYDSGPVSGNQVVTEINGTQIFATVDEIITHAQSYIHVEMYEFQQQHISDELIAAKNRGVSVKVLINQHSSDTTTQQQVTYLRNNGVNVLLYPDTGYIDHVKLLTADGTVGLIGGMNWGTHSPSNHDVDVEVWGPIVTSMDTAFSQDWSEAGGTGAEVGSDPAQGSTTDEFATTATANSSLVTPAADIKPLVLAALNNATQYAHIEMYTLTDTDTVNAMVNAHNRGVDVEVLTDPSQSSTNANAVQTLQNNGVPVKTYPVVSGQLLHAKIGIFDDSITILGSANWTYSGFNNNHETDIQVNDANVTRNFNHLFQYDWSLSSAPADFPTVSLTNPASLSTISGTINVTASASDSSGSITKVEFYVDNILKATDTSSPYSYSLNTTTLSNGRHVIDAWAYASGGGLSQSAQATVTVNNSSSTPTPTATRTPTPAPTNTPTPTPTPGGAASGTYSGSVTSGGSDSYTFTPGVSGSSTVGTCAISTSNDFDLYVYNSSGTLLGSGTTSSYCDYVSLSVTAGQTYTVKTVSYSGGGTYRSAWNVNGAQVVWNVSGTISSSGGSQVFAFLTLSAGTITLSTCGPSGTDFDLYLLSANNSTLASSTSSSTCETITYTPSSRGLFRLKEVSYSGTGSWSGTIKTY